MIVRTSAILVMITLVLNVNFAGANNVEPAGKVMAGCLYHLIRLTEWDVNREKIRVGFITLKNNGMATLFQAEADLLEDKKFILDIKRYPLRNLIDDQGGLVQDQLKLLMNCQVLYFGKGAESFLDNLLPFIQNKKILTVSESREFAENAGMIGFFVNDNRVQIKANLTKIRESELKISAQFLQHASY